jgi:hypothetical protein
MSLFRFCRNIVSAKYFVSTETLSVVHGDRYTIPESWGRAVAGDADGGVVTRGRPGRLDPCRTKLLMIVTKGALMLRPPTLCPLVTTTQTVRPQNVTTQKLSDHVTLRLTYFTVLDFTSTLASTWTSCHT